MFKKVYVFILVICVSVIGLNAFPRDLYEGSKCKNADRSPGVCRLVTECPAAIEQIRRNRRHNFLRCGFSDKTEIACCPSKDTVEPSDNRTESRHVERKCVSACKEYSKMMTKSIVLNFNILNGKPASPGEFPHMVALGFEYPHETTYKYKFDCGGTLITDRHVLSAAHCFVNVNNGTLRIVRAGTIEVPEGAKEMIKGLDYEVLNVTIHKEYSRRTKFNDIAMITLKKSVAFSGDIQPACLYTDSEDPATLIVTGWGVLASAGERSTILQVATLESVPYKDCNETYYKRTNKGTQVTEKQLCAHDDESDACQGDSGGPIQIQTSNSNSYTVVGVTSFGAGCGGKAPGIYTRVYSYLDWIESIAWPSS